MLIVRGLVSTVYVAISHVVVDLVRRYVRNHVYVLVCTIQSSPYVYRKSLFTEVAC